MTFTVRTADTVSSAQLRFSDAEPVPTTRTAPGVFTYNRSFDSPVTHPIDILLTINQQSQTFDNVDTIKVNDELRKILTLEATPDGTTNTALLQWTYTGTINFFKVQYGTNQNRLNLSVTSTRPSTSILLVDPTKTYYAQVIPVDALGNTIGEPSDIVDIPPLQVEPICGNAIVEEGETCDDGNLRADDGCSTLCQIELPTPEKPEEIHNGAEEPVAPPKNTCYPEGIELNAVQLGEQYFITWKSVPYATKYQIYRSDRPVNSISEMIMIGETTETRYQYPFDANAEVEKFARYAVRAVCENDDIKPVGDMTKVKVGPEKTLIILIIASLLVFGMVRLSKSMA